MRRMYSEQELTTIIGQVLDSKIEDGSFDEIISDAVDAYLVEHPVDITALEGKDIELASLDATGLITGGEIVEKMSGYTYTKVASTEDHTIDYVYCSAVKNGNKLTLVWFIDLVYISGSGEFDLGRFNIPNDVASKIYPIPFSGNTAVLDFKSVQALSSVSQSRNVNVSIRKYSTNRIHLFITNANVLTPNTHYMLRVEETFLLSDNLTPAS